MTVWRGDEHHDENWVLRNLLGAKTREELAQRELRAVQDRELDLYLVDGLLEGVPDTASDGTVHLHRHLFQDVYPWAGEHRTQGIAKDPAEPFLAPHLIWPALGRLDEALASGLTSFEADPVEFLTLRFAELNHVHPFLEGNGRVQRIFWQTWAARRGAELDWGGIDKEENHHAARQSRRGDLAPLRELLRRVVR